MNNSTLLLGLVAIAVLIFMQLQQRQALIKIKADVPPFWVTMVRIALVVIVGGWLTWMFGTGRPGSSFPVPGLILVLLVILYSFVTGRMVTGRHIYAVGGNRLAAELSGVNTKKVYFLVMLNMSVLAAFAGMMFVGRSTASGPFDGVGWELDAIAAVFIGGAAVSGGVGTVIGSMIGGLVMAVLNNGLQLMSAGSDVTQMIKGVVLLVAVALDVWQKTQGRASITGMFTRSKDITTTTPTETVLHRGPGRATPASSAEGFNRFPGHAGVAGPVRDSQGGCRNKKEVGMKKFAKAAVVLAAAGALALTGCGGGRVETPAASGSGSAAAAGFAKDAVIGVAMPQKTSENWVLAEQLFNDGLTAAGFKGTVQFANGGVSEQQNQITAMIEKGAKVLIVGAIDGSQLGTQLAAAKQAGITVIAYDRLLTNTPDVDYYVAFDNFKVGELQGTGAPRRPRRSQGRQEEVEHRTDRRLARRQQRQGLLRRRHERPAAEDRRRHADGPLEAGHVPAGRHPGLEGRERPEAHGHRPVRLLPEGRPRRHPVAERHPGPRCHGFR